MHGDPETCRQDVPRRRSVQADQRRDVRMAQDQGTETDTPVSAALLIIDMINDMKFDEGDELLGEMWAICDTVVRLRDEAAKADVPVIYVNDNYGEWHASPADIVDYVRGTAGAPIAERLATRPDDYFVIKPHVSGFYATSLPAILPRLGVSRLILTGVAADICVLFTAADAHMREYALWVPRDAVASNQAAHRDWALRIMTKSMGAETRATNRLSLHEWLGGCD